MLRLIPKTVKYYTSAATALWGARAAVGFEVGLSTVGIVCLGLVPLVFLFTRIEERYRDREGKPKDTDTSDNVGILLSLSEAIQDARFADTDDEAIAEQANKLVRKELDKRCISYKDYRDIRRKNSAVFTAIISKDNQLIGFFDIFPLTDAAALEVLSGRKRDSDIGIDDIVSTSDNTIVRHLYIATILYNDKQDACSSLIGREIVALKLYEFLLHKFPPLEQRTFLAYAHTPAGERLLKKASFNVRLTSRDTRQKRPLFVLDAARAHRVRERYAKICHALELLENTTSVR